MQDRIYRIVEIFLHRTAGPYIRVNRVDFAVPVPCPVYPLTADMKASARFGRKWPTATLDMKEAANLGGVILSGR
jgi:hypothetical protein